MHLRFQGTNHNNGFKARINSCEGAEEEESYLSPSASDSFPPSCPCLFTFIWLDIDTYRKNKLESERNVSFYSITLFHAYCIFALWRSDTLRAINDSIYNTTYIWFSVNLSYFLVFFFDWGSSSSVSELTVRTLVFLLFFFLLWKRKRHSQKEKEQEKQHNLHDHFLSSSGSIPFVEMLMNRKMIICREFDCFCLLFWSVSSLNVNEKTFLMSFLLRTNF